MLTTERHSRAQDVTRGEPTEPQVASTKPSGCYQIRRPVPDLPRARFPPPPPLPPPACENSSAWRGAHRFLSHRSRSPRSTVPRTRITRSSSSTSYMMRRSPTRRRWKESLTPRIVLTALPPIRPCCAASTASFSSARRILALISAGSFLKARAAAGASSTSYGLSRAPSSSWRGPSRRRPGPRGAS